MQVIGKMERWKDLQSEGRKRDNGITTKQAAKPESDEPGVQCLAHLTARKQQ